jgi:hypothetical protein
MSHQKGQDNGAVSNGAYGQQSARVRLLLLLFCSLALASISSRMILSIIAPLDISPP